jgi:guanylate kinase
MAYNSKKKIVVLSGPSCVGKGPLKQAVRRYHPEIKLAELVLCTSRKPRFKAETRTYEVHGIDFYFLPRSMFDQLDKNRFIVANVRSDVQAIDISQVRELLEGYDIVLAEVFHTLGSALMDWVKSQSDLDFEVKNVFLLPLSHEEIEEAVKTSNKPPEEIVYEVMKAKLERRAEDPPHKIEERARSAYKEMLASSFYTRIIVNHAGEDDRKEWGDPLGIEAERVLNEFVKVLRYS